MAPIAQLPPEVLSRIFDVFLHDGIGHLSHLTRGKMYLRITHICYAWRALSLATPSLWTHPILELPRLGRVMLERAGKMPLSVYAAWSLKRESWLVSIVRAYPLRYLHIEGPSAFVEQLVSALSTSLPHLKELYIRVFVVQETRDSLNDTEDGLWDDETINPYDYPLNHRIGHQDDMLMHHAAPRLQKIVLDNLILPDNCGFFKNVAHLEVKLNHVVLVHGWTARQMLRTLTFFPELETLDLSWPEEIHDPEAIFDHVKRIVRTDGQFLPSLLQLKLEISESFSQALCKRISSSSMNHVHIKLVQTRTFQSGEISSEESLRLYFSAVAYVATISPPTHLELRDSISPRGDIKWEHSPKASSMMGESFLRVYGRATLAFSPCLRSPFIQDLPVYTLFTRLTVSIDYFRHELNADDLISACKSFPYLRCISIGAHAAARFMKSLMAHNSNDEDPSYLPALCELHLHKLSVA
jgi:hypothetical protein